MRGCPGRVERALAAIFDRERNNAFTVEDLAERVYPGESVARKHRVSIIRATRNVARRRPEIQWLHGDGHGGPLVIFRHDEVMSYAMARLKADRLHMYRSSHDSSVYRRRDERALRRELDDESHRKLIGPGGAWRRHVDIFLAKRAR
jgi:hypothetical protein